MAATGGEPAALPALFQNAAAAGSGDVMPARLLTTRRYVSPDEILELDSTLSADVGICVLLVRSPVCGHSFSVAADLADVAKLLAW